MGSFFSERGNPVGKGSRPAQNSTVLGTALCNRPAICGNQAALIQLEGGKRERKRFTADEDQMLAQLVGQLGENNWSGVSSQMEDRTPRQCRERWKNYLSRDLKLKWTKADDDLLTELVSKYGSRWAAIAKFFQGRTENSIKNRYSKLKRSQLRIRNVQSFAGLDNMDEDEKDGDFTPETFSNYSTFALESDSQFAAHCYPGIPTVKINKKDSRAEDYAEAEKQISIPKPGNYIWHHHQDYDSASCTCSMTLVEEVYHGEISHMGACSQHTAWKRKNGYPFFVHG